MSDDPIHQSANLLVGMLGPTIVAAMCGEPDRLVTLEWTEPDGPIPPRHCARRLEMAMWAACRIAEAHGTEETRSWFIREDALLADATPVRAIREGRYAALRWAVEAAAV